MHTAPKVSLFILRIRINSLLKYKKSLLKLWVSGLSKEFLWWFVYNPTEMDWIQKRKTYFWKWRKYFLIFSITTFSSKRASYCSEMSNKTTTFSLFILQMQIWEQPTKFTGAKSKNPHQLSVKLVWNARKKVLITPSNTSICLK